MKQITAMQEFIDYLTGVGFVFGREDTEKFLVKEKQDIIDAYDDGQEDMIKFDQRRSPEDYFTQKYEQQ